jgi:hypothetical protein
MVDIFLRAALRKIVQPKFGGEIKDLSLELKQQALFFDQIGIYNADWVFDNLRNGPIYQKNLLHNKLN